MAQTATNETKMRQTGAAGCSGTKGLTLAKVLNSKQVALANMTASKPGYMYPAAAIAGAKLDMQVYSILAERFGAGMLFSKLPSGAYNVVLMEVA